MAAWLFFGGKRGDEMNNSNHKFALNCFSRIFLWIFILFITTPSGTSSFCAENRASRIGEPAKAASKKDAVKIAKKYLNIENSINYTIKIEEKVISAKTFNTYRSLEPGINKKCWVVTLIVPDAVGASRTVYVDKDNGEILGGYSSK